MNARACLIKCAHNSNFGSFLILEVIFKHKKFKINFIIEKIKIRYLRVSISNKIIEFGCLKKNIFIPRDLYLSKKKILKSF